MGAYFDRGFSLKFFSSKKAKGLSVAFQPDQCRAPGCVGEEEMMGWFSLCPVTFPVLFQY